MADNFTLLHSPIRIGTMSLKNRIAFPPMNTNYSNENGAVTNLMIDYYARRAKGGAGLVTVESTTIDPKSKNHGAQPQMTNTALIPGWSRLVDKVHRFGAKISIELNHFGADGTVSSGSPEVSSSNVTSRGPSFTIKSLSIPEIKELQQDYVNAIIYAKTAGFDAITFHAAHGNVMPQFFSTMFNKRTDWYGGSLENRMRFALEIIEQAKQAVGDDFPLIMRISGDEYLADGRKLEETIEIVQAMEKAGIAAFDISGGIQATYLFSIAPYNFPDMKGFMMPCAKAIKEVVSVPVIAAGGVRDPFYAEQLIEEGFADIVSLGRSLIADPDFGVKSMAGKTKDIRPCLSCQNCLARIDKDRFMTCTVNPEAGREDEYWQISPALEAKNVLVVGGGAAGLEAARVAGLRGHHVTLIEQSDRLGGAMYAAGLPPHKEKILELIDWYEKQLADLNVTVKKNTPYTDKFAKSVQADTILVATGASYLRKIPGSDAANVLTALEALTHPESVGDKIVIIGGGASGCEAAEYFGARETEFSVQYMKDFSGELVCETKKNPDVTNKDVTVVEMLPDICTDMESFSRRMLIEALQYNNVKIMTKTKVWDIQKNLVRVIDMAQGNLVELEADTVILAGGLMPNQPNVDTSQGNVIYLGDACSPGKIIDASIQAYCTALEI